MAQFSVVLASVAGFRGRLVHHRKALLSPQVAVLVLTPGRLSAGTDPVPRAVGVPALPRPPSSRRWSSPFCRPGRGAFSFLLPVLLLGESLPGVFGGPAPAPAADAGGLGPGAEG